MDRRTVLGRVAAGGLVVTAGCLGGGDSQCTHHASLSVERVDDVPESAEPTDVSLTGLSSNSIGIFELARGDGGSGTCVDDTGWSSPFGRLVAVLFGADEPAEELRHFNPEYEYVRVDGTVYLADYTIMVADRFDVTAP